ncbi:discoidin domain-containing protein [Actinospica durhamensis]|uniref:Discoidin domain-containing protein n=1 Tax=Actinospica durhamensis TaxID=1508375 RepID=A0A941EUS8_9ACTN|nr:discoidin domain-containing protein [Actinospica durhamensis]MBR7836782.1 discoidin domain-containing protein [Actinospica durhamensis]
MFGSSTGGRRILRTLGTLSAAALAACGLTAFTATGAQAATTPGAAVPFTEYLAATNGTTNGTVLPVDYEYGSLQSEATGRQAVQLIGSGQYVSFTLTAAANAVDFHYAIPDAPAGGGETQPLDLYVNGTLTTALSLTSDYSDFYGPYGSGSIIWSQTPSVGQPAGGSSGTEVPHDFYNDVRYQFSSTLPIGTVVKLQVDSGDNAPWYAINTADFETVAAPIAQPSGYINVTAAPYDADDTGVNDSTTAIQNAINAASAANEGVYIPQGTYTLSQPLAVNNVTVEGAGEWYTKLTGSDVEFSGNQNPASTNVDVSNLSLFGEVSTRDNGTSDYTGFNGGFSSSSISDVWIQNEKVGIWVDGPTTGLTINSVRIQDTTADGINLDGSDGTVTNTTVENSFVRNTGDDGIALFSQSYGDTGDTVTQNTVDSPSLANNIGIYGGGSGDEVTNNLLQDTVQYGGGIELSQNYGSIAFSGTLTISGNELLRTGQFDPWLEYGEGAIWFLPEEGDIASTIDITGNTILDSPYEAFQFENSAKPTGAGGLDVPNSGNTVTGVSITNNTVTNVGTFVFQDQAPGSATVSGTTATGVGDAGILTCGSGFTLTQGSGNSGFSSTACSMPSSVPLWLYPGTTTYQNATVGQASAVQQIAVVNRSSGATTLGTPTVTSGFAISKDPTYPCGSSLDAASGSDTSSWCMIDVSFTAPATGITTGTLTVPSSQSGADTVQLVGSTGTNNSVTPPTVTPSNLSFGFEATGSTSAAQTVTLANPGTSALGITSISTSGAFTETNTCGTSLAAGASCTASVKFAPTAGGAQTGELAIANSATASPIGATLSGTGVTSTTNLALGATMSSNSVESGYPASNTNDGNTSTYWEGTDGGTYPQTLTADLGSSTSLGSVTLELPPATSWTTRSQTLSVLGSTNGSSFTTLVPSASYTFDPSTANTVSFNLPSGTNDRYLQLSFTANSGWTSAQLAEFEIFPGSGSSGSSASLTASPSSLSFGNEAVGSTSAAQSTTIQNTGSAAATISSITAGGAFAETNTCGGSLAAGASCTVSATFSPTVNGATSGSVTVASNATNATLTVALSGTGTGGASQPVNVALDQPITASASTSGFPATNANDGNTSSYWESTDGTWPATLAVDLGTADSISSVVLDLPSTWGTRTQTLSVLGSNDDSTWATLVGSATYTFNPSTGDTVTITLPSGTSDRYVELDFTANDVQNGAQVSEFQVMGQANPNLALNKTVTASSTWSSYYAASNAVDGNTATYWEGTDGAWPTTLTVDLGSTQTLGHLVLELPAGWGTRTQTLSILGSTDDSTWTTLVGSATYTWNPSTGDSVSISLPAGTSDRYVELNFTANSVQNGAQLAELGVYAQ